MIIPDSAYQEALDAVEKHGSVSAAAVALKIPRSTIRDRLKTAAIRGLSTTTKTIEASHGSAPEHDLNHSVPAPFIVRGYSSYYNKDGELAAQWVKTKLDDTKLELALKSAIEALAEDIPRVKPTKAPKNRLASLLNLFVITDAHIGMRAWKPETGDDWDLQIAEKVITGAFDYLIEAAPAAKTAIVNNLGDFLHFDSLIPVTPTSQNPLDADSRYSKVVKVATKILRYIIVKALERHEKVVVVIKEGNHDLASSVWIRHLFMLLFENEPRVEVIDHELPYSAYVHGKTLIGFHHGHLKKNEQLPLLFAAQFPKEWGETKYRVVHVGHRHCEDLKEHNGMKVWQHETIAARDAYAARGGWVAGRRIVAVTYHDEFGEVATMSVVPEMLENEADN